MMHLWLWLKRHFGSAAIVMLGAATCFAAIVQGNVPVVLYGVDQAGNPSADNGSDVTGKAFKETTSGIIVQVGAGNVLNDYGAPRIFSDLGLPVTDPEDGETTYTATNDLSIVGYPYTRNTARSAQLCIFDPDAVPPGEDE